MNKFIKKLFGFSISSWISACIGFVFLLISSHIYPQEELGKINFFISIITILVSILNLSLDQGYLRFYSYNSKLENEKLFSFSIVVSLIFVILFTIILYPIRGYVCLWVFGMKNEYFFWIFPITIFALIVIRFYTLPYRAKSQVLKYTIITVCYSICLKGGYLWGLVINDSLSSALYSYVIISFAFAILLFLLNYKHFKIPKMDSIKIYSESVLYSLPLIPAMLMINLNNSIPQFILRLCSGFSSVALYTTAVTMASAINLLQGGFNVYWAPYVYENYKGNQEFIKKIHDEIVYIVVIFALLFVLFQPIILLFFKSQYIDVGQFLPILMLSPVTYTIGETTQIGINISKKSYLYIFIYAFSIICNTFLSLIFIKRIGLIGASIAAGATAVITLLLKTVIASRYYKSINSPKAMIIGLGIYLVSITSNCIFYRFRIINSMILVAIIFFSIWLFEIPPKLKYIWDQAKKQEIKSKEI